MDPGFLKLLDEDEDDNGGDNGGPAAADVDAFAAVLKGELGGAAVQAAAANAVLRAGNGNTQHPQPQSSAATLPPGYNIFKAVPAVPPSPLPGQQQWNQLTLEQREWHQRRLSHQRLQQQQQAQQQAQQQPQLQQNIQQQQIQQSQHANQQPLQHAEKVSSASGNKKAMSREGISFTALMPLLQPHLPPEQGQQLLALYQKFKKNEITREDFIRGARVIAGDTVLVQTIRQMQQKQQKLQQLQQQAQQAQLQQQTQAQQSQPSQSPQTQQLPSQLALAGVGVSSVEVLKLQPQNASQEHGSTIQKNLQQVTQLSSNPQQEPAGTISAQQKHPVGHSQTFPFQQSQVYSYADNKDSGQGSQPQPHLPSPSLPQTQHQSTPVQQVDRHETPGQGPLLSSKTTASKLAQKVKKEAEKSRVSLQSAKQQLPSSPMPSIKAQSLGSVANQSAGTGAIAASQPKQPFSHTGLPQLGGAQAQAPGHVQLQSQPQMVPRVSSLVTSTTQPQPSPVGPASVQSPPDKPLTKYAKQKLRREQKKRDEERMKVQIDGERQKKAEEESLKQIQNTPTPTPTSPSTKTAGHQGLQPQFSVPQQLSSHNDMNKQPRDHHLGLLSQGLVHQGNKVEAIPIVSDGNSSGQQGQSLVPTVKREPADLQSEAKSQSLEPSKLQSQVVEKPIEQVFFLQPSTMLHSTSHANDQRTSSEHAQILFPKDSIALPAPTLTPNPVQQGGMVSMPPVPPIPVRPGMSGFQPEGPVKERASLTLTAEQGKAVSKAAAAASAHAESSLSPSVSGAHPGPNVQPASSIPALGMVKTPSKKPAAGQKKPADGLSAQQPPSKKQKVSPGEHDQSIDQLNDVTAVSGVNLKEEEEQLLIGPKEESRTTEAMRKIVQEEEENLFLEGGPLRAKVGAIATRHGVQGVSSDVGRCLSMSVEERLRSMLYRIIKLSKQRCDAEKERHKIVVTSDVQRKIFLIKRKAKEQLDTKLAEETKRLRKLNEKKDKEFLPEVEREELKARAQKAQQEEEDRLKANAANVAARAAVGADDMLLKWQMMAEQGRQRRQGGDSGAGEEGVANRGASGEVASMPHSLNRLEKSDSSGAGSGIANTDSQPAPAPPTLSRPSALGTDTAPRLLTGRRLLSSKSERGDRVITVKDVVNFLETESQMSKSTLLFRLYERQQNGLPNNRKQYSGIQRV